MYAVIESGGKQYRVQPGDIVQLEKLEGDVGSPVKFDNVLMLSKPSTENSQIWLGKPYVSGANVQAEIVGQGRGEKILIIKMKRRKQYRRTQGHRQFYTQVLVTGVDNGTGEKATLSDSDKQTKLSKFQSHLKAKGEAFTPKTLGSRVRMAAAKNPAGASATQAAAASAETQEAAAPKAKKTTGTKAAGAKKTTTAKKTTKK